MVELPWADWKVCDQDNRCGMTDDGCGEVSLFMMGDTTLCWTSLTASGKKGFSSLLSCGDSEQSHPASINHPVCTDIEQQSWLEHQFFHIYDGI